MSQKVQEEATHEIGEIEDSCRERSDWREWQLMTIIIRRAVFPETSLMEYLRDWSGIAINLSENPRRRKMQSKRTRKLTQEFG